MSGPDPVSRQTPAEADRQRQQLEYLQGMAKAPMGWPAVPPSPETLDPAALQAMLDRTAAAGAPVKPWYRRREVLVALALFAALFLSLVWLVSLGMK
jgi:hypothetical protein